MQARKYAPTLCDRLWLLQAQIWSRAKLQRRPVAGVTGEGSYTPTSWWRMTEEYMEETS